MNLSRLTLRRKVRCVVACYLVSMLLLKCADNLIIPALFMIIPNYSHIISEWQNYSCIIPASLLCSRSINKVKIFASFLGNEYDEDSEMEIHPAIKTHIN